MRSTTKLAFAGLITTFGLALAVSSSAARRFATSEGGFLIRWTPLLFQAGTGENVFRLSCPVTLEGSFHSRTLSKVCGQLVGYITRAQIGPAESCLGGSMRARTETLPWHIAYSRFFGILPRITDVFIVLQNAHFEINIGGTQCEWETANELGQARLLMTEGIGAETVEKLRILSEFLIPLRGGFFCEFNFRNVGRWEGTGEVFTLVTPQRRITVTLVQ